MRRIHWIAASLLFAASSASAFDGGSAAEAADREVREAEEALRNDLDLDPAELGAMHYAVRHFFVLGGEQSDLSNALRTAVDADCRADCLVFVVESLHMTLRAEIPPAVADDMVEQALFAMVERREASPRCWTDVEQGAWMWVKVDAAVQAALTEPKKPT